jgi:hypothetical protein
MSSINIPIWYHSSGLPASLRAESRAYLNANKTLQLIHRGGSPVAVTEHIHAVLLITPLQLQNKVCICLQQSQARIWIE